jgi:hypothetical protein
MQEKEVIRVAALRRVAGTRNDWAAYLAEQATLRYSFALDVPRDLVEPDQIADISPQELEDLLEALRPQGGTVVAYVIAIGDSVRLHELAKMASAHAEVAVRRPWKQPEALLVAPRLESDRMKIMQLAQELEQELQ